VCAMKIKMLSRNKEECTRERASDLQRVFRNPDPALHPFERAREYTRALNAAKLDKVFAKPFVSAMDGHSDGVFCMAKNPKVLNTLASGACDGELRVWHLSGQTCAFSAMAHKGFVRGLAWSSDGARLLSCGDDKTVKLWSPNGTEAGATATFLGARAFTSIDHVWDTSGLFVTGGASLDVWNTARSRPVHSFNWGVDTIHAVRYNPVQCNVVASAASDRSIALYDTRLQTPVKKLVLQMSSVSQQ
jgi:WD repeat and SOF domain-containing protein 1